MEETREPRPGAASCERLILHPSIDPDTEIDLTDAVTRAVAEEIWRTTGGNSVLNWMEAEAFVEDLLAHLSTPATPRAPEPVEVPAEAPAPTIRIAEIPAPARPAAREPRPTPRIPQRRTPAPEPTLPWRPWQPAGPDRKTPLRPAHAALVMDR